MPWKSLATDSFQLGKPEAAVTGIITSLSASLALRGAEEGVDLPIFLKRAVEASQGEVSAATDQDVLSEDHPRIDAAVRWVRATRFRQNDDHRFVHAGFLARPRER